MNVPSTFCPSPEHLRAYRNTLGQFATGITVVSTVKDGTPIGMTANSFTSVSLEPALVLWCLSKQSKRYSQFIEAETFAFSVLSSYQFELAMDFAKDGDNFNSENSHQGALDLPLVTGALANLECRMHSKMDAGDHTVVIGMVEMVTLKGGDPLIFHAGHFGSFSG